MKGGSIKITDYKIKDALDSLSGICKFEFCFVNMIDIEKRLEQEDLSLLLVLSEKEIEHLERLKINKNKIQWISGRYAVKSALFKYRKVEPSSIDILKGEDLAPYILQYPDICATITHSFPFCIGIVSRNKIGVDLERVREPEESLIRHFYSNNEWDILRQFKGTEAYSRKAMMYWTRKEAASKLVKMGMKLNFKELDTSKDKIRLYDCEIQLKSVTCEDFCVSIAFEHVRFRDK